MEEFLTNEENVEPMLPTSQDGITETTSPEYEQYRKDMEEVSQMEIMTFEEFKKRKCECQNDDVEPLLANFN